MTADRDATTGLPAGRCHRALARLLMTLAGAMVVAVLPATPAWAHAELLGSEPGDGAKWATPPSEVVLQFNEPVDPPPEPIRVFDAAGERVDLADAGPAGDRSRLRVSMRPDLPAGVYVVAWQAISADSHPVRGSFVFTVGSVPAGTVTPSVPPEEAQTGWEVAAGFTRWLTYAGTLLAVGGVAFLVFVSDRRPIERDRLVRLVGWAVAGAVTGSIAAVPLQVVVGAGIGATALRHEGLWIATLISGYGVGAGLRLIALTGLFVGAVGLWVAGWARPLAVAGGLVALASLLLSGHTATSTPRSLAWLSNLSHTAAAAVWLGGLTLLAVVLHSRRAADPAGGARIVARFSRLAVVSVVVMAGAGAALGWVEIRSWEGLTGTPYGQTLLAKAGLVAVVVGIGAYNHRRLVPAIRNGSPAAWRRLRRTVRWEAAILLVGVLAVTAVLVNLVPARNQVGASEAAGGPYHAAAPLGVEYHIELVVDPAEAGVNELRLALSDQTGAPVAAAQQVELRFGLPAADIDRITREPEPVGPGQWRYRGPELSIAGGWEIEVRVTVDDFQRLSAIVNVPVTAGVDSHQPNHP